MKNFIITLSAILLIGGAVYAAETRINPYQAQTTAAFSYATSTAWTGTTTVYLGPALVTETWTSVRCFTDTGTLNVSFYDGTNRMNLVGATSSPDTATTLSSNNTFTAGEKRMVDLGTPASSPTKVSCTVLK